MNGERIVNNKLIIIFEKKTRKQENKRYKNSIQFGEGEISIFLL